MPGSSLEHFRLVLVDGFSLGLERAVISVWVPVPPLLASRAAPSAGPGCSSGDAGSFARRLVAPRSSVLTLDLTPIEFSVVWSMYEVGSYGLTVLPCILQY